jgi:signal peptidase
MSTKISNLAASSTARKVVGSNTALDPWTATLQGDTAYEVRAVIPELGHLIQALRAPVVTHVLLYGAPALLAGWLLLTIRRPTREEEEDNS